MAFRFDHQFCHDFRPLPQDVDQVIFADSQQLRSGRGRSSLTVDMNWADTSRCTTKCLVLWRLSRFTIATSSMRFWPNIKDNKILLVVRQCLQPWLGAQGLPPASQACIAPQCREELSTPHLLSTLSSTGVRPKCPSSDKLRISSTSD